MGQYHHPVCIEAEEGLNPHGMNSGLKEGEQGFSRPSTPNAIVALVCARGGNMLNSNLQHLHQGLSLKNSALEDGAGRLFAVTADRPLGPASAFSSKATMPRTMIFRLGKARGFRSSTRR
jgi:hypothetical protein